MLRACAWYGLVGDFQATPVKDGRVKPILDWRPHSAGFDQAAQQIRDSILDHLRGSDSERVRKLRDAVIRPLKMSDLPTGPRNLTDAQIEAAVDAYFARHSENSGA